MIKARFALLLWLMTLHGIAAAVVFTQTNISGDSDVLNSGTLIAANSVGSGSAVTINGLAFGTDHSGLGNFSTGGGDFSTDPFSSDLDNMLSGLMYTGNGSPGTLNLNSLTVGQDYRLQLFVSNDVNSTGENQSVIVQGVTHAMGFWRPNAVNLTAEFTATTSVLSVSFINNGARTVFNGYALHDVSTASSVPIGPTPVALLLGLIGIRVTRMRQTAKR
ncbi:MAG: hypothetical protein ACPG4N_03455 [Gammaproteobacteria bacterium]